jgi:hypothetical protein
VNLVWSGTATFGSDYTVTASGGVLGTNAATLTFAAGVATATVTVKPVDDTAAEATETVTLSVAPGGYSVGAPASATGSIVDNDSRTISIGNVTVTEADRSTTTVSIPVTLSSAASTTVTVVVSTVAGSAVAGTDFVSKSATLTFSPGTLTAVFQVAIVGDKVAEALEKFTVVLSSVTGPASIATGTGTVTIVDNDGALTATAAPTTLQPVGRLTDAVLAETVTAAMAVWRAQLPSAELGGITFSIADLPELQLGFTLGRTVTLDATAAGWGWSAMSEGVGAHIDLLTVVLHELGHVLGYAHDDADDLDVMSPFLAPVESSRLVVSPRAAPAGAAPFLRPIVVHVISAGRKTTITSAVRPVIRGGVIHRRSTPKA